MKCKAFEIRDHGTFIPAIGILMESDDEAENYLLRRAGYHATTSGFVLLTRMDGRGAPSQYDPYAWCDRTWHGAHMYIQSNWQELESGAVA